VTRTRNLGISHASLRPKRCPSGVWRNPVFMCAQPRMSFFFGKHREDGMRTASGACHFDTRRGVVGWKDLFVRAAAHAIGECHGCLYPEWSRYGARGLQCPKARATGLEPATTGSTSLNIARRKAKDYKELRERCLSCCTLVAHARSNSHLDSGSEWAWCPVPRVRPP
jgi:hypothetical protein